MDDMHRIIFADFNNGSIDFTYADLSEYGVFPRAHIRLDQLGATEARKEYGD
jgi:hypothetical protein